MMPGLLEAPAFLCPLILSFRELNVPEAHFLEMNPCWKNDSYGSCVAG
jgi:hypothetical protein